MLRKIVLPLLCVFLLAYPDKVNAKIKQIYFFTVPKCGTIITRTAIHRLITYERLKNIEFISRHLTKSTDQYLERPDCKVIIVIRDFRDAMVSSRHWRQGLNSAHPNRPHHGLLLNKPIDDVYKSLITDTGEKWGLPEPIKEAMLWLDCPHACIVRFEEIIGEKGGGSRSKQLETFQRILNYLDLPPPSEGLGNIADTIHGSQNPTLTLRKGVIGEWRKEFSEDVKEYFKEHLGWALIKAGYEKDMSW